jgi:hypothetical protein
VACIRLQRCKAEQADWLINPATPLLRRESLLLLQGAQAHSLPEAEEQDTGSSDKIKYNIYFPNKQQPVTTLLRSSVLDFLLSLCIVVSVCSKYVYAAVACL